MMFMLSEHFSLEELTVTSHGLNLLAPAMVSRLRDTALKLEDVRTLLGHPLHIDSCYRSPEVNKAVGGVANSAHLLGYSVDFTCVPFGPPIDVCHAILGEESIKFDQLIQEGTWTHISFDPTQRMEVLTKLSRGGYRPGL